MYQIVFLLLFGAVLALALGLFVLCWRMAGRAKARELPAAPPPRSGAELELLQRMECHLQILGRQMAHLAQAQDALARAHPPAGASAPPAAERPGTREPAAPAHADRLAS